MFVVAFIGGVIAHFEGQKFGVMAILAAVVAAIVNPMIWLFFLTLSVGIHR